LSVRSEDHHHDNHFQMGDWSGGWWLRAAGAGSWCW
jgi:hypothetical protein